jgi:GWxTD domain-containing protein
MNMHSIKYSAALRRRIRHHLVACFTAAGTLLLASLILWGCAGAYRPGEGPGEEGRGLPTFDHEIARLLSQTPGQTDLMILIQIPYDNLQFVSGKNTFRARYEMMVVITDSTGMVLTDSFSTHSVEEADYALTNSRNLFSDARVVIPLTDGTYNVLIQVTDLESQQQSKVFTTTHIQGGFSGCRLSNLILVKYNEPVSHPRDFVPIPGLYVDMGEKDVFVYYEASYTGTEPMMMEWQFIRSPSDTLATGTDTIVNDREYYHGKIPLNLDTRIAGQYDFKLKMTAGQCTQTATKQFKVRYQGLPRSITNLDEAVEELRYIASDSEMNAMRRAPEPEKERLFKEFWQKRDPTPSTEENEQMVEYYRRVDYANQHFSTQQPGWMTDRGMIYIKYGEPSEIIRNLIPANQKPYEIWIYDELNLEFDFVDRTGFGDYELVGPIYGW